MPKTILEREGTRWYLLVSTLNETSIFCINFKIKDNMATVMKQCNCESKFQDELYGKGMRVYNVREGKGNGKARCTVCGREQ